MKLNPIVAQAALRTAHPTYRWFVDQPVDFDELHIWCRAQGRELPFHYAVKVVDAEERAAVERGGLQDAIAWLDARAKDLIATLEAS